MTPEISARVLVVLSMVYGGVVAILAVTDSGALTLFAIVGAIALGIAWVARSFFVKPSDPA